MLSEQWNEHNFMKSIQLTLKMFMSKGCILCVRVWALQEVCYGQRVAVEVSHVCYTISHNIQHNQSYFICSAFYNYILTAEFMSYQ